MANPNPAVSALEHAMWLAGLSQLDTVIACVYEMRGEFAIALFRALALGGPDACPRRLTEYRRVSSASEVARELDSLTRPDEHKSLPVFLHGRVEGRWPKAWRLVDENLLPLLIGGEAIVAGYSPI